MSGVTVFKSGDRRIFADQSFLDSTVGMELVVHPGKKDAANPLLVPDRPWESEELLLFGTVLREGGLWRMWYMAHTHPQDEAPSSRNRTGLVCYAESYDGKIWHKPELDIYKFRGKRSNIVMGEFTEKRFREFHGVIRDDAEPDPQKRYKAIFHGLDYDLTGDVGGIGRSYHTAVSADGLRWVHETEIPFEKPVNPDIAQFTKDCAKDEYLLWARSKAAEDNVRARAPEDWFGRGVSLLTSKDFRNWQDEGVVMQADISDPAGMDIYSFTGFRLGQSWAGLAQVYYQEPDTHVLDIQFASSIDGRTWERPVRKAVLPLGGLGEWDRCNHNTANLPVECDGELRLYYSGRTYRHGGSAGYKGPDKGYRYGAIGLAAWREDGFASLSSSFAEGEIITKIMQFESEQIIINAKADFGKITVTALAPDGTELTEFEPVREDSLSARLLRKDNSVNLAGVPLRLKIKSSNAQLYAIKCE